MDLSGRMRSISAFGAIAILPNGDVEFPGGVETICQAFVSDGFFPLLGSAPTHGRWFQADEMKAGQLSAVIVSERFWRDRLGSNAALGTMLRIQRGSKIVPVTVIGVIPSSPIIPLLFQQEPDLIFPASALSEWSRRNSTMYRALVRLRPGASMVQARSELEIETKRLRDAYPRDNRDLNLRALPLKTAILGKTERLLWLLFLASGVIWLIAAANLGALLTVRLEERRTDFAIRCALGAGWTHQLAEIGREVAGIAAAATAAGLLIAWAGVQFIRENAEWLMIPRQAEVSLNVSCVVFSASAAIAAGLLVILGNLKTVFQSSPGTLIQGGLRQQFSGARRFSDAVVAAQFCLAFLVANIAGLTGRGLVQGEGRAVGYDPRHVVAMRLRFRDLAGANSPLRYQESLASILAFSRRLPNTQAATAAYPRPTAKRALEEFAFVENGEPAAASVLALRRAVAPNFFEVMAIPLTRGRAFLPSENSTSETVVVNGAFVRAYSQDREVIGRKLYLNSERTGRPWRIVGVVGDTLESPLDDVASPTVYSPGYRNWVDLLIRADTPFAGIGTIQKFIRNTDPGISIDQVETLEQALEAPLANSKTQTLLSVVFAGVAILLAAAGLYGLLRHTGENRRSEYAIRIAMGASERDLTWMHLRDTIRPVGLGLVSGMLLSIAFGQSVRSMLFRVPALDPVVVASVTLTLIGVALLAAYVSVRHTTKLDPGALLRCS